MLMANSDLEMAVKCFQHTPMIPRLLLAILMLGAWSGWGQIHDVVKASEIDKMFAVTVQSLGVLAKTNYAVEFRVSSENAGRLKTDADADEFWFVRRGAARINLGERRHDIDIGDVVNVPRTTPYQISSVSRFEYVAVRIFPTERRLRIGIGAAAEPHPMPDVVAKAQIYDILAHADKNVLLHSAGALLINHVVYPAGHGPWEVHHTCDDLYFVRLGTARAKLGGTLINGREDPPGEIRGVGVTGSREYDIAPDDMVVIPRNTAHFMDPGSKRLGYLLVKICD
jgi:mannose-6-phosphate isomerase-like protein (cupin superfamily)